MVSLFLAILAIIGTHFISMVFADERLIYLNGQDIQIGGTKLTESGIQFPDGTVQATKAGKVGVPGPQGGQGIKGYGGTKDDRGDTGFQGDTGATGP